jgi:hypothetical protein
MPGNECIKHIKGICGCPDCTVEGFDNPGDLPKTRYNRILVAHWNELCKRINNTETEPVSINGHGMSLAAVIAIAR